MQFLRKGLKTGVRLLFVQVFYLGVAYSLHINHGRTGPKRYPEVTTYHMNIPAFPVILSALKLAFFACNRAWRRPFLS